MREAQRDDHAVGPNPPPTVGQVPEQHLEAHLDACVVDDGRGRGQVPRPFERARHQAPGQLWVAGEPRSSGPVEDGEARRLEHPPACGPRQRASVPFPCHGRNRSPWPSGSAPNPPAIPTRRDEAAHSARATRSRPGPYPPALRSSSRAVGRSPGRRSARMAAADAHRERLPRPARNPLPGHGTNAAAEDGPPKTVPRALTRNFRNEEALRGSYWFCTAQDSPRNRCTRGVKAISVRRLTGLGLESAREVRRARAIPTLEPWTRTRIPSAGLPQRWREQLRRSLARGSPR